MGKYDCERLNITWDEPAMYEVPSGKQFRIGKFFYLYHEKYFFWFRFFGKWGISAKSMKKKWLILFSERNGYKKFYKLFGWKFKFIR